MTNFAAQRTHMVQSQLLPNAVTDPRLLAAMGAVPREVFVPEPLRGVAYADRPIPVAASRMLLDPMTLARLIQLAEIAESERALLIGVATGYSAAVVARLVREVVAIEENADLAATAREALASLGVVNASVRAGQHAQGLPASGPYDAIVIEGRVPAVSDARTAQLAERGRLAAIIGENATAKATVFLRSDGTIGSRAVHDAPAPPLPGFAALESAFVF
jgi:protein-L-isoaspartate(D-aspartate) O-methyltransferase